MPRVNMAELDKFLAESQLLESLMTRALELVDDSREASLRARVAIEDTLPSQSSLRDATTEERVLALLEALGLRGARRQVGVPELVELVRPRGPVAFRGRLEGDAVWWLAIEHRAGRVLLEEPISGRMRWVRTTRLGDYLQSGAPPIDIISIETALPLAPLAARSGVPGEAEPRPGPGRRLLELLRVERPDVAAVLIYAIAAGALQLAVPLAVQALVNTVAFGAVLQPLIVLSVLLFGALTMLALFRLLQVWLVEVLQRRLYVRLVADLAHRIPRARRDSFDGVDGRELVNRFFDLFTIHKTLALLLVDGLEIALRVVLGLVLLAFYHPILLAFDVVIILVVAAIVFGLGRHGARTAIEESSAKYETGAWLQELAKNDALFKLGGGYGFAVERAEAIARDYLEARRAHFRIWLRQVAGLLALQSVASAAVLGIGGWLVITRQLTLGQLVASELVVAFVVGGLAKFGKHLESVYDLIAATDKVGYLLDLPMERTSGSRDVGGGAPARLRFDRVHGGYREHEIFANVTLDVASGERVVLTGPSGSGKSLFVEMLAGLRAPSGGRIELDGRDLRDVALGALRERIAAVRNVATIPGSLLENVRFARPSVDPARARRAIELVGLGPDVDELPDGIRTQIASDGAPLSEVQALRLTIARAIASEPSLLVIDQVLDGLDHETRSTLVSVLFREDAPWTLIVVSNRRDVLARAGRVLWLNDGAVEPVARSEDGR